MKKATVCFSFAIIALFLLSFYACSDDETPANNNTNPNTVTDIDGNVYHTIKIGTQTWTVENLKVTRYRNGDKIPYVKAISQWEILTTGALCIYDDDSTNQLIYGRLYNWYAATDSRGLAPVGWHIPSKDEWVALQTYLGGDLAAGGKMKENDTLHWLEPNTGATNESGFTGLPGGVRSDGGGYQHLRTGCYMWSTTSDISNTKIAWYSYLGNITSKNTITSFSKNMGYSVRCIKN